VSHGGKKKRCFKNRDEIREPGNYEPGSSACGNKQKAGTGRYGQTITAASTVWGIYKRWRFASEKRSRVMVEARKQDRDLTKLRLLWVKKSERNPGGPSGGRRGLHFVNHLGRPTTTSPVPLSDCAVEILALEKISRRIVREGNSEQGSPKSGS